MENFRPQLIPDPTVRRLSLYLRELEAFQHSHRYTINSKQLGDSLGLTGAQIRKDLAYFGTFGHPGVGYNVADLIKRIRTVMGTDITWNALLIGAGNLGKALLSFKGFEQKMLNITAVFDTDPAKIGQTICGRTVFALAELAQITKNQNIRLALMAVPAEAAQSVADELVDVGIKGILNFAPAAITVPSKVEVHAVDLSVQLEQLAFLVSLNAMSRSGVRHP